MSPPTLDLLIVGAGPVGLATAAAALQHGARTVLVVDQARELLPVGSNIDLLPNAFRVLSYLVPGISEHLRPFIRVPNPQKSRAAAVNADGHALSVTETHNYGTTASLKWWQLQKALLESLPDQNILVLNHQLVNISHDHAEDVAVAEFVFDRQRTNQFKNWNGDDTDQPSVSDNPVTHSFSEYFEQASQPLLDDISAYGPDAKRVTCKAKIIVGADGINSVARRCIYRDTSKGWEQYAEPLYSGFSKIIAAGSPDPDRFDEKAVQDLYMKNTEIAMLTCNEDRVAYDSLRIMLTRPRHLFKAPFTWFVGFSITVDETTFKTASEKELRQLALDRMRAGGFSEALVDLCSIAWESPSDMFTPLRAYYIVPATHPPPYEVISTGTKLSFPEGFFRPWHFGRVVLAGDAAHGCPPFLAQGTAMGFEDVFELMKGLSENQVWASPGENISSETLSNVFEKYRKARLDRVSLVQRRVMNRTSEYDVALATEIRRKLWSYDPSCSSNVK